MTRSIWKGPFIDPHFIKFAQGLRPSKLAASTNNEIASLRPLGAKHRFAAGPWEVDRESSESAKERQTPFFAMKRIWSRRSCILPQFVGLSVQVYNGKKWINLKITGEMVGHKFGEFASTRTIGMLKGNKIIGKMKTKLKVKTR